MLDNDSFTLPILSAWKKKQMLRHAENVLLAQQQMIKDNGKNILHYTLEKKKKHRQMQHYPKGDRIDPITGSQYFYHCHREDFHTEEHGHFHCFIRYQHIPKRIKPTPLEDWDKHMDNPMAHLIAIAMNRLGQPIRLFSVNRWVTSDIWYDATALTQLTKRFKMTPKQTSYWSTLDQWIESMIHLFAPQISWVYNQRDAAIKQHQQNNPTQSVYNNQTIEELSSINIDLTQQIQWVLNSKA